MSTRPVVVGLGLTSWAAPRVWKHDGSGKHGTVLDPDELHCRARRASTPPWRLARRYGYELFADLARIPGNVSGETPTVNSSGANLFVDLFVGKLDGYLVQCDGVRGRV